ncbi:unnamed protein product [Linum trigynum]|uniref:Uncharacterized protein n=1 Tax=Linum trigynum TaxID=586398 RepID=A0AAV2DNS1_9ROSI
MGWRCELMGQDIEVGFTCFKERERLRRKFEVESSSSNLDYDKALPEEKEEAKMEEMGKKKEGDKETQMSRENENSMEVDKQVEVKQETRE